MNIKLGIYHYRIEETKSQYCAQHTMNKVVEASISSLKRSLQDETVNLHEGKDYTSMVASRILYGELEPGDSVASPKYVTLLVKQYVNNDLRLLYYVWID
jgi:hypothetical protein